MPAALPVPLDDREVLVLDDAKALAQEGAKRFVAAARAAVADRGRFVVALAGGATPRAMHARLLAMGADALPWSRIYVTFGDERCVPPDDPASNYGMARETLLAKVGVPEVRLLRMEGELPPEDAALRHEARLRALATRLGIADGAPLFDLVLLGAGADGHTLSLFPGDPALAETRRLVATATAPVEPRARLTLTFAALARTREVLLMAAGPEKRDALARARAGAPLPVARAHGRDGTVWLLDREAAGG
ncbi:6-phosphogluconolactonase [Roseisolibacter sp. H3M3-2]|uniref:6-phosphogluconolactonase n=1 Tax=Roseisolibacter sp. H3M3-2 TaxID=3031323 RepID=UPI0023DC5741|nr:6-phosphogluconolactonase [Roseisolibacter sp. H3M3-2]MDF1503348.1 6-phosphogluconolactonase [Roseisolibacter sp. H3M3-2]